jgi:hypothetical protein
MYRQRYASAARFYAEAFAEQAELASNLQAGHRYDAACAAALAGTGEGKDADGLDESDRAALRYSALCWLQDDLGALASLLASSAQGAAQVQRKLRHWQKGADLAAVRDPAALRKLPESEQVAWRNLWAEVDSLLARFRPSR